MERPALERILADGLINILFVGRFVPNKKPEDLVRFVHAYKRLYNANARLILAGSYAGFEDYYAQVRSLMTRLGVSDVHILGQVTDRDVHLSGGRAAQGDGSARALGPERDRRHRPRRPRRHQRRTHPRPRARARRASALMAHKTERRKT